jgi:hypothetical protein
MQLMKGSQEIGAQAALVQGILFIVLLFIFAVVLLGRGVTSPIRLTDVGDGPILTRVSLIVMAVLRCDLSLVAYCLSLKN